MSGLVEYQRQWVAALLGLPGADVEQAAHPAIEIHRHTVLSALTNALALSFPTVKKLTGPEYFEQLVREFARRCPPRTAVLYDYGAELPDFLASFPGAEGYPYFRDMARFDWLVDQTGHRAPDRWSDALAIPGCGDLRLPISLTCARFDHAVDLVRDAVECEHEAGLAGLDVRPNPRWLVFWRTSAGTSVKALSGTAWHLLNDLAEGLDGASALERATQVCGTAQAVHAFGLEILRSSFAHVTHESPAPNE
jgi:Putative DNA-binding domain